MTQSLSLNLKRHLHLNHLRMTQHLNLKFLNLNLHHLRMTQRLNLKRFLHLHPLPWTPSMLTPRRQWS